MPASVALLRRCAMRKSFMGSLVCPGGIIGGSISMDENAIIYKTNKLTVSAQYRNLVLPLREIRELSWKWVLFPVATLHMASGERHQFILFNKGRFQKHYEACKGTENGERTK